MGGMARLSELLLPCLLRAAGVIEVWRGGRGEATKEQDRRCNRGAHSGFWCDDLECSITETEMLPFARAYTHALVHALMCSQPG